MKPRPRGLKKCVHGHACHEKVEELGVTHLGGQTPRGLTDQHWHQDKLWGNQELKPGPITSGLCSNYWTSFPAQASIRLYQPLLGGLAYMS